MRIKKSLFVLLLITVCGTSKSQVNTIRYNKPKTGESPGEIVSRFYNWYLKKVYLHDNDDGLWNPDIKLTKDSIYKIMPQVQFNKLKKTGFFSDKFYKNKIVIYNKCDVQLRIAKPKDVNKCGCSPAEFAKNNDCDCLSYYTWVGGQGENLNAAKIEKINTVGNISKVTVGIYADKYLYSHPEVTLLKENGKWKIANIEVHF